jgi:AbrB family looped-hinge helix DNA binding protein
MRSLRLEFGATSYYLTFVLHLGVRAVAATEKLITTVSTKGQVILPSAIRKRREWDAGTRLLVEVLLKPAPVFAETRPEDVFGSLPHRGRPKTLEEMDAGVLAEARRRHARD